MSFMKRGMNKRMWLFGVGFFLAVPSAGFAAESSCVACHQKLGAQKEVAHSYQDWSRSVHARKGIDCSACHGGDPKAGDPVQAHQGVLPSKDSHASIHFQKVPETCGRCHTEEYKEFQKSAHYRMLERSGKGPNCLTCHGSMATFVLPSSDLEKTCSLCHGKPVRAAKALSLIRSVKNILDRYEKKHPSDKKSLALFKERYQKIQREWHSFDVNFVIEESEKLLKEIHTP